VLTIRKDVISQEYQESSLSTTQFVEQMFE
jgi:hypothetical protein